MEEYTVSYLWNNKRYSENIIAKSHITDRMIFLDELFNNTSSLERI